MRPNAVRRLSARVFYAKAPAEIVLRKLNISKLIFQLDWSLNSNHFCLWKIYSEASQLCFIYLHSLLSRIFV